MTVAIVALNHAFAKSLAKVLQLLLPQAEVKVFANETIDCLNASLDSMLIQLRSDKAQTRLQIENILRKLRGFDNNNSPALILCSRTKPAQLSAFYPSLSELTLSQRAYYLHEPLIIQQLLEVLLNKPEEYLFRFDAKQRAGSYLTRYSVLKHSIAGCFSSVNMDLRVISTTRWNSEKAQKYFAGVLWGDDGKSPKPSGYYVEKLGQARGLAGLEGNEPDTIQKIVQDQNLRDNEWWKCVKDLLGDDKVNDKANSPTYPLLKSLDDLLDEGRNKSRGEQLALLDDNRMQLFVDYFGNLRRCWNEQKEKHIEWCFDDCLEKLVGKKDKYTFHDWLTALDEALDRLRGSCS